MLTLLILRKTVAKGCELLCHFAPPRGGKFDVDPVASFRGAETQRVADTRSVAAGHRFLFLLLLSVTYGIPTANRRYHGRGVGLACSSKKATGGRWVLFHRMQCQASRGASRRNPISQGQGLAKDGGRGGAPRSQRLEGAPLASLPSSPANRIACDRSVVIIVPVASTGVVSSVHIWAKREPTLIGADWMQWAGCSGLTGCRLENGMASWISHLHLPSCCLTGRLAACLCVTPPLLKVGILSRPFSLFTNTFLAIAVDPLGVLPFPSSLVGGRGESSMCFPEQPH